MNNPGSGKHPRAAPWINIQWILSNLPPTFHHSTFPPTFHLCTTLPPTWRDNALFLPEPSRSLIELQINYDSGTKLSSADSVLDADRLHFHPSSLFMDIHYTLYVIWYTLYVWEPKYLRVRGQDLDKLRHQALLFFCSLGRRCSDIWHSSAPLSFLFSDICQKYPPET